jgi:hypothetical protein
MLDWRVCHVINWKKRLSELESKIGEAKNIIDVTPNKVIEE